MKGEGGGEEGGERLNIGYVCYKIVYLYYVSFTHTWEACLLHENICVCYVCAGDICLCVYALDVCVWMDVCVCMDVCVWMDVYDGCVMCTLGL